MSYLETAWRNANVDVPLESIQPKGDFVLVKILPDKDRLTSGIVLPESKREDLSPREAIVIAVGPGDMIKGKRQPMHVQPGDRVLCWRTPANQQQINGDTVQFLHEEQHIVAVLGD